MPQQLHFAPAKKQFAPAAGARRIIRSGRQFDIESMACNTHGAQCIAVPRTLMLCDLGVKKHFRKCEGPSTVVSVPISRMRNIYLPRCQRINCGRQSARVSLNNALVFQSLVDYSIKVAGLASKGCIFTCFSTLVDFLARLEQHWLSSS